MSVFVPGVGAVEPGEVLESDLKLRSPYLETAKDEIKETKKKDK